MNTEITTVQSLVAEAQRCGLKVSGGFQPRDLLPLVESHLQQHTSTKPNCSETSTDMIEWKETLNRTQEFISILKSLPERLPYEKFPAKPSTHTRDDFDMAALKEKVEKILSENHESVENAADQSDTTVPHPSDTRRSPVPDPLTNASSASPNA